MIDPGILVIRGLCPLSGHVTTGLPGSPSLRQDLYGTDVGPRTRSRSLHTTEASALRGSLVPRSPCLGPGRWCLRRPFRHSLPCLSSLHPSSLPPGSSSDPEPTGHDLLSRTGAGRRTRQTGVGATLDEEETPGRWFSSVRGTLSGPRGPGRGVAAHDPGVGLDYFPPSPRV